MIERSDTSNQQSTTLGDNRQSGSGFTLLEILIAVFIFSIIIVILFRSHDLILYSSAAIDEGISGHETAQTCLDRMILDLGSAYVSLPPEYTRPEFDTPAEPYRVVGDETSFVDVRFSRLRFASTAHVAFGDGIEDGIAELVYYVQETDEGGYVLRRADSLYPYEPFEESAYDPVLCDDLRRLTFTYYDDEGEEHESWDSESSDFDYATPVAVGIRIETGEDEPPLAFETMVMLPVQRKGIE